MRLVVSKRGAEDLWWAVPHCLLSSNASSHAAVEIDLLYTVICVFYLQQNKFKQLKNEKVNIRYAYLDLYLSFEKFLFISLQVGPTLRK